MEAIRRAKPSLFSIERWRRRHGAARRQGTQDGEAADVLTQRRRDNLWDNKDDPTESEEEEMAAAVRCVGSIIA